MFIERAITPHLKKLSQKFPVLGILGPRQSGKTTLARALFPKYKYVNLEALDTRRTASEDPRLFLKSLESEPGVILDEIQRVPELLSYIQVHVDEWQKPGFFILTGSQNILLNQHISQTLAGRIALTTLLPLSLEELQKSSLLATDLETALFKGFYPPLHVKQIEVGDWIPNYIQTYVERDIRDLKQITDLNLFQKFIRLCAGRVGQILDLTSIGNDCGIATNTVRSWLSVLEACYIIFLLQPYHRNFSKRLIKSPKLYFYDTAIACQLLGIASPKDLYTHYLRGWLFESMILSDLMKQRYNEGHSPHLYFWRDKSGLEVDCIWEEGERFIPIEIKSGETFHSDFFSSLVKLNQISGQDSSRNVVVYGGDTTQTRSQGTLLGWRELYKFKKP